MSQSAKLLARGSIAPSAAAPATPAPPTRLWLCAHFPDLALTVLGLDTSQPAAAVEAAQERPIVYALSGAARAAGLKPGMTLSAALASVAGLAHAPRDVCAERTALTHLAEEGLAFTCWVSVAPPADLFLEVSASLRLFGGTHGVRDAVRRRFLALGHCVNLALAPTTEAASLLARIAYEDIITEPARLRSLLNPVPIEALQLDLKLERRLRKTGMRYLVDLWRLPRDGLARRYGKALLERLDALAGLECRGLEVFHKPPQFSTRREFFMAVELIAHFFPAITEMVEAFMAFLASRDAAATALTLALWHPDRTVTRLEQSVRSANRVAAHWLELLHEKLQGSSLAAPVIAVELHSTAIEPFRVEQAGLFDSAEPGICTPRAWQALLDRLQARLGVSALKHLGGACDNRPEHATNLALTESPPDQVAGSSLRPLWLLREPERIAVQTLTFLSAPERIESGWWDGQPVRRDYRIARDRQGRRLWVFHDLDSDGWYLHGYFG